MVVAYRAGKFAGIVHQAQFQDQHRIDLVNRYTGCAVTGIVASMALGPAGFGRPQADAAVKIANETVLALERFYSLAATPGQGHG